MQDQQRSSGPQRPFRGHPRLPTTHEELGQQLPVEVRQALESLRMHGPKIVGTLEKDEQARKQFIVDPLGAMHSMGINLPPALARLRRSDPTAGDILKSSPIRLPNGQTIIPSIKIRFTDGE